MRTSALLVIAFLVAGEAYAVKVPLLKKLFGKASFGENFFAEAILKINQGPDFAFYDAYRNETTIAYYSSLNYSICWLKMHETDELAHLLTQEIGRFDQYVFRYGNIVGFCPAGDTETLAKTLEQVLKAAGKWEEEKPD